MKVLFAASEAHPFIKTGGLGDVMGALPKSLIKLGVDVRVVIPKYKNIKDELKQKLQFVKWFTVSVGWRNQYCGVFQYQYKGVTYYFIDNEYYFNRDGLYGYFDDGERFAFFNRAVLEFIKQIDWQPDLINCNDWQTGMVPVLLNLEYKKDEFYSKIKTVFSIHNLLFKGSFSPKILPELFGYDYMPLANGSVELDGAVSFLKGGLNYCDQITTVSKTYAEEIKTPQYGEGLDGFLRSRSYYLMGIVNGIDYEEFNPQDDKFIFKNFNANSIDNKVQNKLALQRELGLPQKKDTPMIGLISRLTHQKGCDLIVNMIDRLLQKDIQLVILGTGDYWYEETFKNLQYRYPDKVSANIKFDNTLAHKIYAATDMFLMPSLFEPCGLGQLIALRYGSIPIVRETGGLKDTISPYNKYNGVGNGFGFKNFNSNELMQIMEYALTIYNDKNAWNNIIRQAMNSDNSWEKSAMQYKWLYEGVVKRP
ncbi:MULTISPECIES: glycogen synthase GlgA [unclassified Clostridium]|jgi:starch synthase|uniref:glycogen synthase GlgA n=1 Tax=unclassified Clostridium TaxID=2614128 RepID=UPI001C8BDB82|nr:MULTISPECIES: glycogen synthase GlgA [unclassified Clostridium]MBX9139264.1 glycogen synthase GlgA [Clostridium sp. K12(2020)]MBX9146028.1 glycogen synthase GlgA [Clostridium sp. K13]MDU2291772.1 glycogen synthase GlgA [Clostridium celatum]MDU4325820.1 glycogen synthase GlgA [Clostridium celatum]